MATTPNYEINYNDARFQNVENEKQAQLSQMNNAYNSMINNSDQFYQNQINAVNDYKNQQTELQQAQTDFAIEQINQQKEQAQKDYTKEQKGAYVDWQKQSNQYGANAEQMAANGLTNSGYSESSQVSMYNTYQNRVSTAKESYNQAVLNYNNSIKEAQLANNSALAEIAYNALQNSLQLSLEGFQYKNTLIQTQLDKQQEIDNTYYTRWQNVLSQMNTENALAEEVRQYNESLAQQQKQYEESVRQYNETMAFNKQKAAQEQANWEKQYALSVSAKSSSGGSSSKSSSSKSSSSKSSSSNTKLTNSSSSSLNNSSSSKSSSSTSAKYTTVMNTARTLYNTSKAKSGSAFVEDYLARAINNGQITTNEASKILKSIGVK